MTEDVKPNFLFIFPDQWRGDCLSSLGHPVVETPFLDQLAAEGVAFTAAYSACPTCIATRACVITGQTPYTNGRQGYRDGVPWRYPTTLMRCLRDGGYQTLCAGKTHFYPQRVSLGFEAMQLYDTLNIDPGFESDYRLWLRKETNGTIRDSTLDMHSNSMIACPWTYSEALHANTWTVTAAIDLLQRRDPTRPFFLQLSFHRPHPPLDPPLAFYERYLNRPLPSVPIGEWAEMFDCSVTRIDPKRGRLPDHMLARARRAYYAQIAHLDSQIGRLIHFLRRHKWLDNTYIIFASDHGELLGDHLMYSKTNPWEGSAHVPLIIRPPAKTQCPRGTHDAHPISHYDLMPTILQEAGLTIPDNVEGASLYPLVHGQSVAQQGTPWRDFIHGEHAPNWQFVTDGREKLIWDSVSGTEWFFDLTQDPQECRDRSQDAAYTKRVALWRERLVDVLATRPEQGLSDGNRLITGKTIPAVNPDLLERQRDPDGIVRPLVDGSWTQPQTQK